MLIADKANTTEGTDFHDRIFRDPSVFPASVCPFGRSNTMDPFADSRRSASLRAYRAFFARTIQISESEVGKMKRRIRTLAILLAVVMLLSMLPVSAMKGPQKYNIWIGGIQVTAANQDDVQGDGGTVRFSPGNGKEIPPTLTLTNASITGGAVPEKPGSYGIYIEHPYVRLELVGTNTVTSKDTTTESMGVNLASGSYAVSGDGTLNVKAGSSLSSIGIYASYLSIISGTVNVTAGNANNISTAVIGGNLSIYGGSLTAVGGNAPESYGLGSKPRMEGGTVTAIGQTLALRDGVKGSNEDAAVTVNTEAKADGATEWDNHSDLGGEHSSYKYVKIECGYGLWVQGVKVTDANKNDVLGDGGSVRYTPVSFYEPAKLTLKNAHITGAKAIYDDEDTMAVYCMVSLMLELVGNSTISGIDAEDDSYGIYVPQGDFYILGDGTLNVTSGNGAYSSAIYVDELTMMSGTVSAASGSAKLESEAVYTDDFYMEGGSLTAVGGSAMGSAGIGGAPVRMYGGKITAIGGTRALYSEPNLSELYGAKVKVNEDASATGASDWDKTSNLGDSNSYRYVSIRADYGLWVQGMQVNADNQNDVLGDGGSVIFRSDSFYSIPTLTLKNASIAGAPCPDDNEDTAGIVAWIDLNLELVGNSTVTGTDAVDDSYGIIADDGLYITGDGKLTVKPGEGYYSYGISAYELLMQSGTVRAESNAGIYEDNGVSAHDFYMEGGVLEAVGGKAPDSYGVWSSNIEITGGILTATGQSAALYSNPDLSDFPDAFVRLNTAPTADGSMLWDGVADLGGYESGCRYVTIAPFNPFADVKEGAFYYDPVLWAVHHEPLVTNGTDLTHFSPDATCTRGQVVTFLWRAAGCPAPTKTDNPFADVKESAFYYKAVLWAVENGITNGTGPTTFSPDQGCTRGQVVTFLYRFEHEPAIGSASNPFTDVKEGAFYYDAVLWAVKEEITKGVTPTAFGPAQTCTRGQIVTFLYRDLK